MSNRQGPSSPEELGAARGRVDLEASRLAGVGEGEGGGRYRPGFGGKRLVQLGVVLVLMLSAVGVYTAWTMYTMIRTAPGPMRSPDGTMVAVQTVTDSHGNPETHMRVAVEILDARTDKVLFRRQTRASAMRRWDVGWMGSDRLTLLSTEIGRLMWTRGEDGVWRDDPANAPGEFLEPGTATSPAMSSAPSTAPSSDTSSSTQPAPGLR